MTPFHEASFDERFQITGSRPIRFLLAGFARVAEPFTVYFADGRESFLTMLLAIDEDRNELIVDCSGSQEQNRRFTDSERNVFVARPEGVLVQFGCGEARETDYEGSPAFALPLPKAVVRLQRREYFRIETPRSRPVRFVARQPDGERLDLVVHDISVGGVGVDCPFNPPEQLSWGLILPAARILLPEEMTPLVSDTEIRQITALEGHRGTSWRIGLRFCSLSRSDENRLQRYIAKVEHERRELI